MPLKCVICNSFYALTLRLLVYHIRNEHCDGTFRVSCNVDGCPNIYTRSNSYYRHVFRNHQDSLDSVSDRPVSQTIQFLNQQSSGNELHNVTRSRISEGEEEMEIDNANDHEDQNMQLPQHAIEAHNELQAANLADHNANEVIEQDHDERTYQDFHQKEKPINFIVNLKEFHCVKETTAHTVATGVDSFVRQTIDILQHKIKTTLAQAGIEADTVPGLQQQFDDFELPFDGLQTKYARQKYIKQNYFYVAPEEVVLGEQLRYVLRNKKRILDVKEDKFWYIPICKSIEQLLQNKDIYRLVFDKRTRQFDNKFYCDVSDGSIFRDHALFSVNPNAFQILLYFDDIEICNPLGKKAGVHKLGVFYYSLLNLPLEYRSKTPSIRLVAIIKRKNIKTYGMNTVLQRINDDLIALESGVLMNFNEQQSLVKGALIGFCGDTLAAHEFAGFKEGVGFAYQKCRHCECTFDVMQAHFAEKNFILRSLPRYDQQVEEMLNAQTIGMRKRLSSAYGITRRSTARDFPHFNLITMIPEDIMHILFEGVVIYETKLVLAKLFEDGLCTIKQLNYVIENFPYGYKHKECKPNCIPEKLFDDDDTMTLKQSSSSMIVFFRLLPIFLVKQLNIDSCNEYVHLLTELCEIVQIIMAPVISVDTIQMLKVLIPSHLRQFKHLFPDQNIMPKQHYMGHLPYIIEKYGPLVRVWCMRFESKHQFFKESAGNSRNFQNLEKSLSDRSAMYECALNLSDSYHPIFQNELNIGRSLPSDLREGKNTLNAFFGIEIKSIKHLHYVSWIVINGQKFISKKCIVAFGESDGLPEFGQLCNILVTQEEKNENLEQLVYFELKMFQTICFDEATQSHIVKPPRQEQSNELVRVSSIFVPFPLHAYKLDESVYIPVTYDMTDVVKQKKGSLYCL